MNAQLTRAANHNAFIALTTLLALVPLSSEGSTTRLDFEGLSRGEYVTTQFAVSDGVTITGFGGSNFGARIFDTNIPSGNWISSNPLYDPADPGFGDPDLGSPNQDFGGPGVGSEGGAGQPGENAVPLNNILIVDENGPDFPPDDQQVGGTIIASFSSPQDLVGVGLLSVDDVRIDVFFQDPQAFFSLSSQGAGENGYFEIPLNLRDVTELWFVFGGGGGVAYIEYGEIPEPASATLLGLAAAAIVARRRRRR